jgi:uncharacterized membrane protein
VLLLGLIYYMADGDGYAADGNVYGAFALVLVGSGVYDVLWKAMQDKKQVALGISFLLLLGVMSVFDNVLELSARATYIHVGALFGTCMALNVWMRIWPAQRKIITAIKAGDKPEAGWGAIAGLRSKHNTYMSVPLIYIMISQHHPEAQAEGSWMTLAGLIVVSWAIVFWIYKKAAKPEVAAY